MDIKVIYQSKLVQLRITVVYTKCTPRVALFKSFFFVTFNEKLD